MPNVDLTPQSEIRQRKTRLMVSGTTKLAAGFLAIILIGTFYVFFKSFNYQKSIKDSDEKIVQVQAEVDSLNDVATLANLSYNKFSVLKEYLSSQLYFSHLVSEMFARKPEKVIIQSISFSEEAADFNISGVSADYYSITNFVKTLASKEYYSSASAELNRSTSVFDSVELSNLSFDAKASEINFKIVAFYNREVLRK